MDDLINRQEAIDAVKRLSLGETDAVRLALRSCVYLERLPSAKPTLYGYDIKHLELIANILQKENLPPEKIAEVLTDISRIVSMVRDEFEETLRKAVERCKI